MHLDGITQTATIQNYDKNSDFVAHDLVIPDVMVGPDGKEYKTEIGTQAFSQEDGDVRIPAHLTGSLTIEDGIDSIGEGSFRDCENLTSMNLGSVKKIGDRAIGNCTNLTSLDLSNVTSLFGVDWCIGCEKIQIVTISASTTLNTEDDG